jgi:hypothetical protein
VCAAVELLILGHFIGAYARRGRLNTLTRAQGGAAREVKVATVFCYLGREGLKREYSSAASTYPVLEVMVK